MIRFGYSKNKRCKLQRDLSTGTEILGVRPNQRFTLRSLGIELHEGATLNIQDLLGLKWGEVRLNKIIVDPFQTATSVTYYNFGRDLPGVDERCILALARRRKEVYLVDGKLATCLESCK